MTTMILMWCVKDSEGVAEYKENYTLTTAHIRLKRSSLLLTPTQEKLTSQNARGVRYRGRHGAITRPQNVAGYYHRNVSLISLFLPSFPWKWMKLVFLYHDAYGPWIKKSKKKGIHCHAQEPVHHDGTADICQPAIPLNLFIRFPPRYVNVLYVIRLSGEFRSRRFFCD